MSECVRMDVIGKAQYDALMAMAGDEESITALAEKAEALLSLAEKAEELLALLESDAEPTDGGGE